MEVKIAVLLARSDMFPRLAMNFLNGLKLQLKAVAPQFTPKLVIESIGNATDEVLIERVEKMILQEDVDVVVGFCSSFMLDKLAQVMQTYKKPFIHLSLGARVLKVAQVNPYMLYQSLNLVESCYLSGKMAAENLGKRAAVMASFYDGGYHTTEAFVQGYRENGGAIIYNYVSQMDYKIDDFKTLVEGIQTHQPDVLFGLFSYKEAERVFEVITANGLDHVKVMALPTMVDESVALRNVNPENVQSVASWAFEEDSQPMKAFKADYVSHYQEVPNIFGILGNEVGTVLGLALNEEGKIPSQIGTYMASKTIQSPRGELQYTERNESFPKQFKVRQLSVKDGFCENAVLSVMDAAATGIIYEKMGDLPLTGWKNPYICT